MRIEVTDQHIMMGVPGYGAHCPVALAMKDRGFKGAHVVKQSICWDEGDAVKCVPTPQAVKEFIEGFDNELMVCAFNFELRRTHED